MAGEPTLGKCTRADRRGSGRHRRATSPLLTKAVGKTRSVMLTSRKSESVTAQLTKHDSVTITCTVALSLAMFATVG